MSVLIKGLKLPPVGIRQCIVSFADNCLLITDVCGKILFEGEYVEVPTPHGRLIDADEHIKLLKESFCGDRCERNRYCPNCGIDIYIRVVENEPTVIKAEV